MMAMVLLRRTVLLAAPFAIACLVLPSQAAAQEREGAFERTLNVTAAVDLEVLSGSGLIRVQPGAAGTVRVAARLRADGSWLAGSGVEKRIRQIEQNPPIEQQGNVIRIGRFADDDLPRNISISYEVTVPADTKLAARTGSGGIEIGAVKGPADVNSSSGSITIDGRPSGPWSLHASSGGVTMNLPPDSAFDLDARTNSGTIDSVHPVTMTVTGKIDKRRIDGKVRGGGPLVQVSCSSGDIRIR
jgi:hypothetical protein